MTALPTETGIVDLMLDALVDLITETCKTGVLESDASRAVTIKAGLLQDRPDSVNILIHENDPDAPQDWPHQLVPYGKQLSYNPLASRRSLAEGTALVGGGSQFARSFCIEIDIRGKEVQGLSVSRAETRQIAAVVENRVAKALLNAGPKIGTGSLICDDFGESVINGPMIVRRWTDPGEGEALRVRKVLYFRYLTSVNWSTSGW